MKKWKILNDSDRQSQSSKQGQKNSDKKSQTSEARPTKKPYLPLKRKNNGNDQTLLSNKSRTLTLSRQLFESSISQKYIRYNNNCSIQIKTEIGTDLQLATLPNLEQFQQKKHFESLSNRAGSGSLRIKRSSEIRNLTSKIQTERNLTNNSPIDELKFTKNNHKKELTICKKKMENLQKEVTNLSTCQQQLTTDILSKFGTFFRQLELAEIEILAKIGEKNRTKVGLAATTQYSQYKARINDLESQKQVFLQTLIGMSSF